MSITEWVLQTYNAQNSGLEEAKNFTFIWSLFENHSRGSIFKSDNMRISDFEAWVNSLDIKTDKFSLVIEDKKSNNSISNGLIDNINKSFNHFYQKYDKDKEVFLNLVFNQNDAMTQKAKGYFKTFAESMDKTRIQSKIIYLFYIAKRMRNKFFHGIKSIEDVKQDSKEFEKISGYLISIISLIEKYD
ncbi:hypothetical protein [Lysinibacillus sp. Y5S-8]|uniref:hypothetical protein n=1 Tax=unclassified Lysinibacillus TaxID=2636778 RepID=UPI0030D236D2